MIKINLIDVESRIVLSEAEERTGGGKLGERLINGY